MKKSRRKGCLSIREKRVGRIENDATTLKGLGIDEAAFSKTSEIADGHESLEIQIENEKIWENGGGKGIRTLGPPA